MILSRAFIAAAKIDDLSEIERLFVTGARDIRETEARLAVADASFFEANRIRTREQIYQVAEEIGRARA
ncbi:hypothetical protein [Sphingomonas leidyi]|uniref:hypothetical protein n=1 Tax=Sphingomonas leidyi TaxID=68569 RepID=UPI0036D34081